jgi:ferredoxin
MVPADNLDQPFVRVGALKQTRRVMLKDENVCLHCGLCAERCPTYAWDDAQVRAAASIRWNGSGPQADVVGRTMSHHEPWHES